MNGISYLLSTEVKAKNLSSSEKIANELLKPVQYLWNGKKIDLIQEGDQKAVQFDFIYQPHERSWKKTALMIMLLIPSTLLGAIYKAYAVSMHHNRKDDAFIKKCLERSEMGIIFTPQGQSAFGEKILAFIAALQSTGTGTGWNRQLSDTSKPLFLSEVDSLSLHYEESHFNILGWTQNYIPKNAETNRKILDGIHFLWNLSQLFLADHYLVSKPGIEVQALKEIDPVITSLKAKGIVGLFGKPMFAKEFFSNLPK